MGTNYYLETPDLPFLPPCHTRVHVGKSSIGWVFLLHVDSKHRDLPDWINDWSRPGAVLVNEYGVEISPGGMQFIITHRGGNIDWKNDAPPTGFTSWKDFHMRNYSEPGPNGLLRCKVDGSHCVKHGDGTWDCIAGEFS